MARRLIIAGVDRWQDYERGSLSIEQVLTSAVDSCSFSLRGNKPNEGDSIIVEDDSIGRLFAGIIDKVELSKYSPDKTIKLWKCDAQDETYTLDKHLVVETYQNAAADLIVKDILAKYCPDFSDAGVQIGAPVIEYLALDYKRPSEAIKEVCEYVGWEFYVDYYKVVHFFNPANLAQPAPMTLEPGGYFRNLKHTIDTQGLRNRVYVRGGTMLSDPWTYEIKADGSARAWVLPHKPHDLTVKVGGEVKTVGIENVHEESQYDYLMNYQEKYVRCSAQTPTPAQGVTLSFTYRYDIDVITMVEDIASQQAIAAVQGGDGIYEHVIVDDSLTTIDAAEAAGCADLREHANPRVKGSFETEVSGWAPGQLVTINLPDRGIQGTFLVQKVTITPCTPDKWTYRVEYGGRLLGIADWLQALWKAQQKKKLNETALLHKFHYGAETAKVTDELQGTLRIPPWLVEEGQEILVQPVEIASVEASFSRSSVAYKQDGTQVAANVPRFETGKFGKAVMVEEGTTNLVSNSDVEIDTTGWTTATYAGSGNFILDTIGFGSTKSLKIEATADGSRLAWITPSFTLTENTTYTVSVWVKVSGLTAGSIVMATTPSYLDRGVIYTKFATIASGDTDWVRAIATITVEAGQGGTFNIRLWAEYVNNGAQVWFDRIQVEQKPYATSFINGTRSPESLTIPTAGVLNDRGPWTVECWAKANYSGSSHRMPFAAWNKFYVDLNPSDKPQFSWVDANNVQQVAIATNALNNPTGWHYWAFTWDGVTARIYVDGVKVIEVETDLPKLLPAYLTVGWGAGRYYWNGLIDDLRVSSRARTDEEIAAAYQGGQPLEVDEWTTCKLNFDGTLVFPGGIIAVGQLQTVGSLLSLTAPAQIATSFDGQDWTEYQDAEKYIEVPYPGYVKVKSDKRTWVYNWKKPFVETDAVCGFVVCG